MLKILKSLLEGTQGSVRQTEIKLEPQVAVCAVLLEVAHADQEFTEEERHRIAEMLQAHFDLDAGEAEELMTRAQGERAKTPDLWPFTRAISQNSTPEEKSQVLEMVWRVVFADGRLDAHEDQLVRKLQSMLAVNHSVVIAAKQRARQDPDA